MIFERADSREENIVLLMLFQRNDMPAELHPGFASSLIILRIPNEISLILEEIVFMGSMSDK